VKRPRSGPPARWLALVLSLSAFASADVVEGVDEVAESVVLSREQVDHTLSESVDELWFCDPQQVDGRDFDRDWCALATDAAARCPGLAAACSKQAAVAPLPANRKNSGGGWVGNVAEPLFWLLLAVVVSFVLYHLLRALSGLRRERVEEELGPVPTGAVVETAPAPTPTLSDAERWLELAQQAAAASRYGDAIRASYAGLAHSLRAHGLLALEAGQTNGELLRSLAEQPELAREFRAVAREMEVVEFGGRQATREGFDRAFVRARSVVQKLAATMATLLLCLALTGCDQDGSGVPRAPEQGPAGHHLLKTLLTASGAKVRKRYLPVELLNEEVQRVIVTGQLEPETWSALLTWTAAGGELVTIAADPPILRQATGIVVENTVCGSSLDLTYLNNDAPPLTLLGLGKRALRVETIFGEEHLEGQSVLLNSCGKPYWASVTHGDGYIHLIAEHTYLMNASLTAGQNALFVSRQLGGEAVVEFVGPWTGSGASSPVSSLRRSGLMPAVLHLLLLGVFFVWRYGSAFGRRSDPRETRQRSFVEHVRVLGACYERAQATRLVLAHYGGWLIERLSRRALAGRRGGVIVTAGAVAARTGITEGEAAALVTEVKLAQGAPADGSAAEDLLKIRRLEELERKVS
jgi:hypothetical protein